jgi:catechol 2,3-dioxygenase-like lactoylglutathione lyase family enzyme
MSGSDGEGPLGNVGLVATTLYVSDLDEAVAWYGAKLGLEPMAVGTDTHGFASFLIGGAIVVLEPIEAALEPGALGSDNTTLNVLVDRDPAEVRAELLDRGVSCGELVESGYLSFLVRDLDGNRFYVSRALTREGLDATREAEEAVRAPTTPAST